MAYGVYFSFAKSGQLVKTSRKYTRQQRLKHSKAQYENLNPFGRAERRPAYKRNLDELKANAEQAATDLRQFGALFFDGLRTDSMLAMLYN